jgi:hypothetical protein
MVFFFTSMRPKWGYQELRTCINKGEMNHCGQGKREIETAFIAGTNNCFYAIRRNFSAFRGVFSAICEQRGMEEVS